MSWFRKNPLFAFGVTVCGLIALGECGLIYERWAASRTAAKALVQRRADLAGMSALNPPPTREVATAIETDLEKAQKALASMQSELKGRGSVAERIHAAKAPAARTDAFFDLATYVEKMRELAKKHDVEVRAEAARFGFAAYVNEGPAQDHIEPVFRQRQIAQYLVETLLEARPRAVFAVKRERTVSKAEKEAREAAIAGGQPAPDETVEDGPDYFVIDPRVTARVAGFVDTTAFRFVFTGQTSALRTFLNKLASFELPVLVREVEVDVATAEESTAQISTEETPAPEAAAPTAPSVVLSLEPAAAPAAKKSTPKTSTNRDAHAANLIPIVSKPLSKFTVTVEFVELVTPPPPPADGAAPTPPSS